MEMERPDTTIITTGRASPSSLFNQDPLDFASASGHVQTPTYQTSVLLAGGPFVLQNEDRVASAFLAGFRYMFLHANECNSKEARSVDVIGDMSLGVREYIGEINRGDTAELYAALREREGVVGQEEIASVEFVVQLPSGILAGNPSTLESQTGTIHRAELNIPGSKGAEITGLTSTAGFIVGKTLVRGANIVPGATVAKILSGTAVLMDYESTYLAAASTEEELEFESAVYDAEVEDDGRGYLQWTNTDQRGRYLAQAQFTLVTQEIRSVMVNFAVEDPFNIPPPTEPQLVAEEVWLRFEDMFDSVEGGPILRDYTLSHFDVKKIERFIPEALLDINVQMPPTQYSISYFARPLGNGEINPLMPLLTKGVMCKVLLHMVRSYIEQPVPQGAQIAYEDRTRYAQAWQASYTIEREDWISMVRLYKRQELNLGHSALLVGSKAGRLFFNGTWRTQNVGRGFF